MEGLKPPWVTQLLPEKCVTGILGLAQSTVSKHLKVLEDAELIDSSRDGAWVNYKLMPLSENQYAALLQSEMKRLLTGSTDWLDLRCQPCGS